jgi:predicted RNA-binding Zn ribbon-like protein
MARDFYNKMPQRMRINVLQDMFEDPDLFLEMMKKVKTQEEKQARIPALLEVIKAATGIRIPDLTRRFISSDPTGTLEEYPEDPEPDLPQLQGAATPPTMSPPPAAPSPAFGPVDRSQYAALFPSDIASGLIRQQQRPEQQGIGSLV